MSWKNTENYKTFSVPIKEEVTTIGKNDGKSVVTISYKIEFIDSARFMAMFIIKSCPQSWRRNSLN